MNLHVNIWPRLQSLGFVVFAAVLAFGVGVLFLPILKQRYNLQQEMSRLDREIDRQEALERQQKSEIDALKHDRSFLERTARNKLNLARPGEIIFRFEQPPGTPTQQQPHR